MKTIKESGIHDEELFMGTASLLILGPSKLRTSEAPARITGRVMQYAPLKSRR